MKNEMNKAAVLLPNSLSINLSFIYGFIKMLDYKSVMIPDCRGGFEPTFSQAYFC